MPGRAEALDFHKLYSVGSPDQLRLWMQLGTGVKMDHYGISAIHWNTDLGEIDQLLLHKVERDDRNRFALGDGERVFCDDVARLIRGGDKVWVMQSAGRGRYKNTDHVGINVKRGRQPYLYSHTKDGTPTTALADLPRYDLQNDPLGREISADTRPPTPRPPQP